MKLTHKISYSLLNDSYQYRHSVTSSGKFFLYGGTHKHYRDTYEFVFEELQLVKKASMRFERFSNGFIDFQEYYKFDILGSTKTREAYNIYTDSWTKIASINTFNFSTDVMKAIIIPGKMAVLCL